MQIINNLDLCQVLYYHSSMREVLANGVEPSDEHAAKVRRQVLDAAAAGQTLKPGTLAIIDDTKEKTGGAFPNISVPPAQAPQSGVN